MQGESQNLMYVGGNVTTEIDSNLLSKGHK